jgi:hypothetical protein
MTIVYRGVSIGDLADYGASLESDTWITDTFLRAAAYANAKAGHAVSKATNLKEHAAVIAYRPQIKIQWFRRPEDHGTLDVCEDCVPGNKLTVQTIILRPGTYQNTLYGKSRKHINDILRDLDRQDIDFVVIS